MRTWVAIANELLCAGIQILLGTADAFLKRSRSRLIEDVHSRPRPFGCIDSKQAGVLIHGTRRHGPDLPWRQRVVSDAVLTLKLRRGHELLYAVCSHLVAEVRIPKFRRTNALLL